jgi:hypothetical protein
VLDARSCRLNQISAQLHHDLHVPKTTYHASNWKRESLFFKVRIIKRRQALALEKNTTKTLWPNILPVVLRAVFHMVYPRVCTGLPRVMIKTSI